MMRKLLEQTSLTRTLFFVFADIALIALAIWLAFFLRFEGQIPALYWQGAIIFTIIFACALIVPLFFVFNLYSLSWRHVSTRDVITLWRALTIGFLALAVLIILFKDSLFFAYFPRSVLMMSYILSFLFLGTLRLGKRISSQAFPQDTAHKIPIMIVGAGDAGEQLVRHMREQKSPYFPLCFVDDSVAKQGMRIHGVQVVGRIDDIPQLVERYRPKELLVAMPSASREAVKKAVELGRQAGLERIKIVPSLTEIMHGDISLADVREVEVKDLLGREAISSDMTGVARFIAGKAVLVTGAAGSIGSELTRQCALFSPSLLILLDQDETGIFTISEELKERHPDLSFRSVISDIRDEQSIREVFQEFHPEIVFHAAAYKHVPLMEENAKEAVFNNVIGTDVVARTALKSRTGKFVFISTDKAVNPSSVMGATKRLGELLCSLYNQQGDTKFFSVRFGNVLDSRGNVITVFKRQIQKGGPVKITHPDMKRYFMTTPEACLLVLEAGAMGQGGELFILDMGDPMAIMDLAREMIRLSGFEPDQDIPIVFTGPRPGEKFFEELFNAEEQAQKTAHKKIFSAKLPSSNPLLVQALAQLSHASNKQEICKILQAYIPSFRPQTP